MPFIRVPDVGVRGMIELSDWTDAKFSALLSAIESSPIEVPMQPSLVEIAKVTAGAASSGAVAFASMVQAVTATRRSFPGNDQEYVKDLLDSASEPRGERKSPSEEQTVILKDRLPRLLAVPNLGVSSKATELLFEREKIASDFLVITDVRPVFEPQGEVSLNSMLILHSLKIDYVSDGDAKEFFLAIDDSDLSKLVEVAQRALNKGKALAEKFNSCEINVIKVRGGE